MTRTACVRSLMLATLWTAMSPACAVECFSVFDTKNALTYQSPAPPIDLSGSISVQMARRFPGRYLVISDLGSCPENGVAGSFTSTQFSSMQATSTQAAALLPSQYGDGAVAFGADATSPAPARPTQTDATAGSPRVFTRAPGGRR